MLPKANRISSPRLIAKLAGQREAYKTRSFVFKYLPSHFEQSQFSISISSKTVSKAVHRNRLKRQFSECLRQNVSGLQKPIVCLMIQKKGTTEKMEYQKIQQEILQFINHLQKNV